MSLVLAQRLHYLHHLQWLLVHRNRPVQAHHSEEHARGRSVHGALVEGHHLGMLHGSLPAVRMLHRYTSQVLSPQLEEPLRCALVHR
jgi:hypothetical protein